VGRLLPSRLAIGGDTWKVHHCTRRPAWVDKPKTGDEGFVGYTDWTARRIWVQKTDNPEADSQTLAHEIDHVLNMFASEASEKIADLFEKDPDLEERLVSVRERSLWLLLRDNDFSWTRRKW
jgi:hypothetical protein